MFNDIVCCSISIIDKYFTLYFHTEKLRDEF